MGTLNYFYLLIILLLPALAKAVTGDSSIITSVKLRIVTYDNKPYSGIQVTVAYNTYYLINQRGGYCWVNVTDTEGYSEFSNIIAQTCIGGYCVAIRIDIPVYNLEFTMGNIRVQPSHTFLIIKLPFIDARSKDIQVVDERNNPLNGTFSIYYGDKVIHRGAFTNGNLSLRDSPTPLLGYTGRTEILIENIDRGSVDARSLHLIVEPSYRFEIFVEELSTPHVEIVSSSKLVILNKLVVRTSRDNVTETNELVKQTSTHVFSETNSTSRSWFNPLPYSREERGFNKLLLIGPFISIIILVYEVFIKKRIGG